MGLNPIFGITNTFPFSQKLPAVDKCLERAFIPLGFTSWCQMPTRATFHCHPHTKLRSGQRPQPPAGPKGQEIPLEFGWTTSLVCKKQISSSRSETALNNEHRAVVELNEPHHCLTQPRQGPGGNSSALLLLLQPSFTS